MTTEIRMSARETAAAWLKANGAAKTKISDFVAARAKESSRKTWARLAKAITEGDTDRVAYYAADFGDRKALAEKLKASAPKAKTKAAAPKAKPAPKPKAAPKRTPAKPAQDNPLADLAASLKDLPDAERRELAFTFLKALL